MSTLADPARLAALAATGLMDSAAEEAFDRLTRMATRLLGVPVALISLVDDGRHHVKSAVGLDRPAPPLSHSLWRHVVAEDRPLVVSDARTDPRVAENPVVAELSVGAYASVPLTTEDRHTLGALCAIDTVARTWSVAELELLTDVADAVVTEIALRTANRTLREAEREAAARASHLVSVIDAMSEGYALIADGEIVDVNAALCRLTGYTRDRLLGARTPFPHEVPDATPVAGLDALDPYGGTFETVFERADGSRFAAEVTTRPARHADGGLIGIVQTVRDLSDRGQDTHPRRPADRDPLTGLLNRRAFQRFLAEEVTRAERQGRAYAVAMLDIDQLNAIKDRYGASVGDVVLRETASRIAGVVRDGDRIARTGGEEFAWLLPDATAEGAHAAAERARVAMTARPFPGAGRVTVSIGVCELVHARDAETLYRRAAEALQATKQAGRNRVVVYTPAPADADI